MKIFSYLDDAKECLDGVVIALGNFDGIHKGHQKLISEAVGKANELGCPSVIFTFRNHPLNEISKKNVVKCIMDINEKASVAERLGVDYMVNITFDRFIMKMSPDNFVDKLLVKGFGIKHAVCGFNYSFGYKGEGTPELLIWKGKENGFGVTVIPEFSIDGQTVSSTFIRGLIETGDMIKYRQFTGRTYKIGGYVMHGQKFGRTMGFPTANLNLSQAMALPVNGVYVTKTWIDGIVYDSVTNVGNKPTVGEFEKNAESHVFDFDGDIYGKRVIVEFIEMLRPEIHFGSTEELSKQINSDCINAKRIHEEIKNEVH